MLQTPRMKEEEEAPEQNSSTACGEDRACGKARVGYQQEHGEEPMQEQVLRQELWFTEYQW